jgi:cysteine desulfurase
MQMPIYLDHHSTTPVDARVFDVMRPWFVEAYGNPHSAEHAFGWRAEAAVEAARSRVAALIGAAPAEIVFTSGATESNNLALQGAAASLDPSRRHIVVTATAHPCVAGVADLLETRGHSVTRLHPDIDGQYAPERVAAALRPDTGLVSIECAHHEFGAVQAIADIAALLVPRGIIFHSDAAQALGKVPVSVVPGIDLMSLSAHKLYGPMGIGALYVRRRAGLGLTPLFAGGGQQRGIRPGTVPTPLAVGFGEACRIAQAEMADDAVRHGALRDRLLGGLAARVPGLAVNGGMVSRLPHNLNVRLPGIAAADLLYDVRDTVAISTGSACASAAIEPSRSLIALGLSEAEALSSIRIGLGRSTQAADIPVVIEAIAASYRRLLGTVAAA